MKPKDSTILFILVASNTIILTVLALLGISFSVELFIILPIVCLTAFLFGIKKGKYIKGIIENEGYSAHYFYEKNRMISDINYPVLHSMYLVMLSSDYSKSGNLQMAFSTIMHVNPRKLHGVYLCIYYNNFLYYYLQAGDMANAERVYLAAKPLIEKYIKNPRYAVLIHTLALREYMIGNYNESLAMLKNTINVITKSNDLYVETMLDMGRVYIKLGNLEKARELLSEVPKAPKTDYSYWQAQQLLGQIQTSQINS